MAPPALPAQMDRVHTLLVSEVAVVLVLTLQEKALQEAALPIVAIILVILVVAVTAVAAETPAPAAEAVPITPAPLPNLPDLEEGNFLIIFSCSFGILV